jgi:hypothetical protein
MLKNEIERLTYSKRKFYSASFRWSVTKTSLNKINMSKYD